MSPARTTLFGAVGTVAAVLLPALERAVWAGNKFANWIQEDGVNV